MTLVESNGLLTAAWYSNAGGEIGLEASTSSDRGATWSPPHAVASGSVGQDLRVLLVEQDGEFLAAWRQSEGGPTFSVWAARLGSDGTWSSPQRLSADSSSSVRAVGHETGFTVTWEENHTTLISRTIGDGDITWGEPTVIGVGPRRWTDPFALIASQGDLLMLWGEKNVGGIENADRLRLARSEDGGSTWSEPETVSALPPIVTYLHVAQTSSEILLGWPNGSRTDLITTRDGGRSWETSPWTPLDGQEPIRILADDENMIIATYDAGLSRSDDGGLTWSDVHYIRGEPSAASWDGLGLYRGVIFDERSRTDSRTISVSRDFGRTWAYPMRSISTSGFGQQTQFVGVDDAVLAYWNTGSSTDAVVQVVSVLETSATGGRDRYETAVLVSRNFEGFAGRIGSYVYIATGSNFPDALVAAAAAAERKAPLILTRPDGLDPLAVAEIQRLDPEKIIIVGGVSAVGDRVRTQAASIVGATNVTRLAGANRYETARLVVTDAFPTLSTLYLATGRDFPDALAASAAAASIQSAVMITDGRASRLGTDVEILLATLEIDRVVIAGGTAVVSRAIESQLISRLGVENVIRLGGTDRFETSSLLNASGGPFGSTVYFATGLNFADALGGAALAGATQSRLFTVPPHCVPTSVLAQLGGVRDVRLLGGPSVLGAGVLGLNPCTG